ncbi:hypothetical protein [Azotosporobacter soli]|uniref:hypothetical protein n=1 Tax=Azotosporobacter soli TaxID=3055040 RepID=UPI0031FEB7E0
MQELFEELNEDELTHLIVTKRTDADITIYFPPPKAPLAAQRAWLSVVSQLPATARISINMGLLNHLQKLAGVSGAEPSDVWWNRIDAAMDSIESYQTIVQEMQEAFELGQGRIKSDHISVITTVQNIRGGYEALQKALGEYRVP